MAGLAELGPPYDANAHPFGIAAKRDAHVGAHRASYGCPIFNFFSPSPEHGVLSIIVWMSAQYEFDVIVIGGGHAGAEAALAAARMGASTVLLSSDLDSIAKMSCNPAIGGVAKGQIVREIDALGGAMGRAIDATAIQFRMLNRRKGPAMHGPRAQADKHAYQHEIKRTLESQPNLILRQDTGDELLVENVGGRKRIVGVRVLGGAVYKARAVVLSAGTFMRGVLHVGEMTMPGGRMGEPTYEGLSRSLAELGFTICRFKTGTPPRINARSIDYSQTERQDGDEEPEPFSFMTDRLDCEQVPCWIVYTNEKLHDVVRANLHRAPMFTGQIQSTGPRYCPSFETKIIRFADKERHQLFLEPEGRGTQEVYINGFSTSLPREVQDEMIRLIPGLQKAEVMRYAYAIEYDYMPPDQLKRSMETKEVEGLFFAGQVNGTTGYEEAAAQGLLAGANAALMLQGKEPFVPGRHEGYLGVMVDDLITRGVDEPYRMFTSRAEYRLLLRADNADRRLTAKGREIGLVDDARWSRFETKRDEIARISRKLESTHEGPVSLMKILRRPETTWEDMTARVPELSSVPRETADQVVYDAKYAGYLARQEVEIERQRRLADRRIPEGFDYSAVRHLRQEAREKFEKVRPADFAQAGRISGITPADLTALMVSLEGRRKSPSEG